MGYLSLGAKADPASTRRYQVSDIAQDWVSMTQHVWALWPLPEVCEILYNSDIQEIIRGELNSKSQWASLSVVRLGVYD